MLAKQFVETRPPGWVWLVIVAAVVEVAGAAHRRRDVTKEAGRKWWLPLPGDLAILW